MVRGELAEGGEVPLRRTQVGGSLPGVPVVTTAQRSGRSRRTGANAMSLVFYLYLSVCRCVRLRARDAAQFMLFATEQELPGVFPLSSLFSRWLNRVPTAPLSRSSRHACLSSQRHLSLMLRCPLGMLGRSRRVWPTASLLTWRSIADSTYMGDWMLLRE